MKFKLTELDTSLGELLQSYRLKKGLTIEDVSKELKYHQYLIKDFEKITTIADVEKKMQQENDEQKKFFFKLHLKRYIKFLGIPTETIPEEMMEFINVAKLDKHLVNNSYYQPEAQEKSEANPIQKIWSMVFWVFIAVLLLSSYLYLK